MRTLAARLPCQALFFFLNNHPYLFIRKIKPKLMEAGGRERQPDKQTQKDTLNLLVHSSDDHNSWVGSFIWVFQVSGCRSSSWLCITCCFPRCISRGLNQKQSSWDFKQHSSMECQCCKWWLNSLHHYGRARGSLCCIYCCF